MALKVGDLYVLLSVKTGEFGKGMASAAKQVEQVAEKMKKIGHEAGQLAAKLSAPFIAAVALAAKHNKQVGAEVERMKGAIGALANELAVAVLPVVRTLSNAILQLAGWFKGLDPELRKSITSFATYAAGALAVVAALGQVAGVAATAAKALGFLGTIIGAEAFLPVAGAVAAIVAGLAAWVVILGVLREAYDRDIGGIRKITDGLVQNLKEQFGLVVKFLAGIVDFFIGSVASVVRGVVQTVGTLSEILGDQKTSAFLAQLDHAASKLSFETTLSEKLGTIAEVGQKAADVVGEAWEFTASGIEKNFRDLSKALGLDSLFNAKKATPLMKEAKPVAGVSGAIGGAGGGIADLIGEQRDDAAKAIDAIYGFSRDVAEGVGGAVEAVFDAGAYFGDAILGACISAAGAAGDAIMQAVDVFSAGGLGAGLLQVVGSLLTESESFKTLGTMVQNSFGILADTFGVVLDAFQPVIGAIHLIASALITTITPVFTLLGMVLEPLGPPLIIIGELLSALAPALAAFMVAVQMVSTPLLFLAGPALKVFFDVIKFVSNVVVTIAAAIGDVWNGVLGAIQSVLRSIGEITIAGAKPLSFLSGWADALGAALVNTTAMRQGLDNLNAMTWESAQAKAEETAEVLKATDATEKAANAMGEMINIPRLFKHELTRFNTRGLEGTNPFPDGVPKFAKGGSVSRPTLAVVGEGGETEHIFPESKLLALLARTAELARLPEFSGAPPSIKLPDFSSFPRARRAPASELDLPETVASVRGGSSQNVGGVTVNLHGDIVSNDPEKWYRDMERVAKRKNLARYGAMGSAASGLGR